MVQRRRTEHEFPPRPCPVDLLESQAFSRACEHARKVLPPAPKFLPGLPPLMPPPAVRLQTQDAAAGPAPARVHEGAALSDDDEDDGLLPGQAAPGDGFVIVHDPSLTGMPLYCCCMALQRLPAKDALALRATSRTFRERITFLSLALRPPLGVVGRKWDAFKKATKTLPTAEAIKGLERRPGGKQGPVPRALRALLKPFDTKKGSWHRLRRAADACANNSRTMLDVMLCVDQGNVASRNNDFEAARGALGEELVNEKGLSTNKASLTSLYRMDKSFAAAACRVLCGNQNGAFVLNRRVVLNAIAHPSHWLISIQVASGARRCSSCGTLWSATPTSVLWRGTARRCLRSEGWPSSP